jgi:hypothetical protein
MVSYTRLLKLLWYSADHFERFVALVAVLVLLTGINQCKVACFKRGLLPCFIDQCTGSFYNVGHVHYSSAEGSAFQIPCHFLEINESPSE